jgi:bacterioferritin
MDRNAVIAALNEALTLEYAAVVQYAQCSYCVKGFRRLAVAGWFFDQATTSLTHARLIGDKIVALGGIPTTRVGPVKEAQDLTSMVKLSLEMERRSVKSYQPVMRLGLTLSDEKRTAERYTMPGSGVAEVERPWCLQPVYQPDPRAVFRHPFLLPPLW